MEHKLYRTQVRQIIEEKVITYTGKIALYPFGRRGRLVKDILNEEYGIEETYLIDNLCSSSEIINIDTFKRMNNAKCMLILCTDNAELKEELQKEIDDFNLEHLVDMFPAGISYYEDWGRASDQQTNYYAECIYNSINKLVFNYDQSIYDVLSDMNIDMDLLFGDFEDWLETKNLDIKLRRAYNLFYCLLSRGLTINNNDILVGNMRSCIFRMQRKAYPGSFDEKYGIGVTQKIDKEVVKSAVDMGLFFRCPGGHVIPNYSKLLNCGIDTYLEFLTYKYKKNIDNWNKRCFYKAEIIVIRALQEVILRYGRIALNSERKDIYEVCMNIAHNKPATFLEAVQLLWLQHEVMVAEGNIAGISIGRLDQFLYQFYKNDIDEGRIDDKKALDILCSLWNKFKAPREYITFANVTLGGFNKDRADASNELTLLCMEAQNRIRNNQPMLSLRTNEYTDDKIWDKALEVISTGMGVPALFNDNVVMEAKQRVGISKEDAYDYAIIGCVEPAIQGSEYSHTEGLRINVCKIMELMLFNGACPVTGKQWKLKETHMLDMVGDFDSFYEWYKSELINSIEYGCEMLKVADWQYAKNRPVPYLSLLMNNCIEQGMDVTAGGTKYNNLSVNFAGMANVVNSLYVIKKLVYEENMLKLEDFPQILINDYADRDELLHRINELPKYGHDFDEIDMMMKELIELSISTIEKYNCDRGGMFQAGFYTVWLHSMMGEKMVATPDGRRKGKALASSLSPAQGTDTKGVLAVFNSLTKQSLNNMGNGMVLDVKFSKQAFENQCQRDKMREVIKAFFKKGGHELQINVVNRDTLVKAQKNPEEYRNLLVRVSGFSTYFVELNKTTQDEIIARTELE